MRAYVRALPWPFPMEPDDADVQVNRGSIAAFRHPDAGQPDAGRVWILWALPGTGPGGSGGPRPPRPGHPGAGGRFGVRPARSRPSVAKRPCKNQYGVYWQNYGIMRQGAHGAFVLDELSEARTGNGFV